MTLRAEPVLTLRTILGEGALWDSLRNILYWIDIDGKKAFEYDPLTGLNRVCELPQMIGTIVPRKSGGVAVALQDGIYSLDFDKNNLNMMVPVEQDNPQTRFNDGKCDPEGRFWAGTMGIGIKNAGTLYRIDRDLSVHAVLKNVGTSNGIIWDTKSSVMYYVDSPTHTIDSFDYESQSGKISNRRVVVRIPDGYGVADGIWLDENGKIWAAHFRGGCVRCWDPITGRLIETVEVPGAKMVTACTFGGTNLDELYITTASINLDEKGLLEQPCAGFLFRVSAGVRGIPAFAWDA